MPSSECFHSGMRRKGSWPPRTRQFTSNFVTEGPRGLKFALGVTYFCMLKQPTFWCVDTIWPDACCDTSQKLLRSLKHS